MSDDCRHDSSSGRDGRWHCDHCDADQGPAYEFDDRLWRELDTVGFDLETTGLDTQTCRIVTAALVHNRPNGSQVSRGAMLVDPGIEIPDEAAGIHGITTQLAREQGADYAQTYTRMRTYLDDVWRAGHAVVVYNAPYDLSVIDAEGRRLGWPPLQPGIVLDPLVLDRAMTRTKGSSTSRKLKPTTEYHKVRHDAEHDAVEDVLATLRILWKMKRHPAVGRWTVARVMRMQEQMYRARGMELRDYYAEHPEKNRDPASVGVDWPMVVPA